MSEEQSFSCGGIHKSERPLQNKKREVICHPYMNQQQTSYIHTHTYVYCVYLYTYWTATTMCRYVSMYVLAHSRDPRASEVCIRPFTRRRTRVYTQVDKLATDSAIIEPAKEQALIMARSRVMATRATTNTCYYLRATKREID